MRARASPSLSTRGTPLHCESASHKTLRRPSLVHPGKDVLGPLLGRVGGPRGAGAQHVVDGLHDLGHLLLVNDAVPVDVVHPESGEERRERVEMRAPSNFAAEIQSFYAQWRSRQIYDVASVPPVTWSGRRMQNGPKPSETPLAKWSKNKRRRFH